ncbi:penicillin acylase family protein [Tautonia rosea]|uniref:penicillin acylase family protein n=1 Tax=Tautonia rosea TaxID=2728037 RepID=UPI0019CF62CA|nr:penicillin acylase family protein [Tautonia rosea]
MHLYDPSRIGITKSGRPFFVLVVSVLVLVGNVASGAEERLVIEGLDQPVEVLKDRWGISHIYAQTEHDLFFAQGFNAARDRLFQLELWRRQATGTVAEIQGPKALQGDIGARLLKFRGDMTAELAHYHPRGAEIILAFVEGINAYIDLTLREPSRLPLPFQILGIAPGHWTPEVVVSRHNGLFRNATQEVQFTQLVHLLGSERARALVNLKPGLPALVPDETIDTALFSRDILQRYADSRSGVRFEPEDVKPEFRRADVPEHQEGLPTTSFLPDLENDPGLLGSNNWAVAGGRTLSGHPLLANDPHRSMQIPSLRYWVHLVGPDWDVIGGGEPALPGISIGHNRRGAWGLTIFPIDQEDLYVYETNPDNPLLYRYQSGWESMRVLSETFLVKGEGETTVDLKFTRHGPVLYEDHEHHRAYALRAAWLEVGTAPYLASLRMNQASTWEEFRKACRYSLTPSENMVWADVDGHIGWQSVGLAPIRKGWNGLLPVPGDGRFEWEGFLPADELPHRLDPPEGWIGSANQNNLPQGYSHALGFVWADPFRFARVSEVLSSGRLLALGDMVQLQQDELSIPARLLVPLLRGLEPKDDRTRDVLDRLMSWDFVLDRGSISAAIYVTWEAHLKEAVGQRLIPKEVRSVLHPRSLSTEKLVHWLTSPDGRLGADPVAVRDAILIDALHHAQVELTERLGTQMDQWQYGQVDLKHIQLHHALSRAVDKATRAQLDPEPRARGGNASTVNNTSDAENQASGASFRMIAVVGDWDRSLGTNAPGQSGDPGSSHYDDLLEPWSKGRVFPVISSRSGVEAVTEATLQLFPTPGTKQAESP